jgi:gamma-glutamylaminecyclotransferase
MALLFVYGTLKEGFCNFRLNEGRRIPGDFATVKFFQLYVLGPLSLPWMIEANGQGFQVKGQLYEVTEEQLSQLDKFERVHEPGWLTRKPILVRAQSRASVDPVHAYVYLGDPDAVRTQTIHLGPVAEYTREMDAKYGDAA